MNEKAAAAPAADTTLPLLYNKPVVLDSQKHAAFSLNPKMNFGFAATANAVPLNLVELPFAMRYYPIAFTANKPSTPVAILGLRKDENLFVDEHGQWASDHYIPAYIRRYPFIFATDATQTQLALCIDDVPQILQKSDINPLFSNGKMTGLTERALEFCKSYQAASQENIAFSAALDSTDLLIDKSAELALQDGKKISLAGFRLIDEEKFLQLNETLLAQWQKKGWMKALYAHILSMGNWQTLNDRLRPKL